MSLSKCLTLAILLLSLKPFHAHSQSTIALEETIAFHITEHWRGLAELKGAVDIRHNSSAWYDLALGGAFNLYEGIYAVGLASLANANYFHLDNKDLILALHEGIHFEANHNFVHRIFFEERNLRYRPSKVKVNATRLSYDLWKNFLLKNSWIIGTGASIVVNIKSDVSIANFLQRIKVGLAISRQITENSTFGLQYKYFCCGKSQSYIGDSHDLHSLTLAFTFRNF